MKIYVIFGQRKEGYPGEYAPEALQVIDEFSDSENPDWLRDRLAECKRYNSFESVQVVTISVDENSVMSILRPYLNILKGTVE